MAVFICSCIWGFKQAGVTLKRVLGHGGAHLFVQLGFHRTPRRYQMVWAPCDCSIMAAP